MTPVLMHIFFEKYLYRSSIDIEVVLYLRYPISSIRTTSTCCKLKFFLSFLISYIIYTVSKFYGNFVGRLNFLKTF
jgi:hypothetical protein